MVIECSSDKQPAGKGVDGSTEADLGEEAGEKLKLGVEEREILSSTLSSGSAGLVLSVGVSSGLTSVAIDIGALLGLSLLGVFGMGRLARRRK